MPFRLHVRAMIRDGSSIFMGSQSLRKLELDARRELGLIAKHAATARQMQAVFEEDWAAAAGKKADADSAEDAERDTVSQMSA